MNNQYVQNPLKWSLKPSKSILASPALVGNTKRVFTMSWFCTNCTKFVWLGHDEDYIQGRQKFFSFFHQNSISICWDVGVNLASDFKISGLHNCLDKVAQTATKHWSVPWRKSASGNYYGCYSASVGLFSISSDLRFLNNILKRSSQF